MTLLVMPSVAHLTVANGFAFVVDGYETVPRRRVAALAGRLKAGTVPFGQWQFAFCLAELAISTGRKLATQYCSVINH